MKFIITNSLIVSSMKAPIGLTTPREPYNLARLTAEKSGVQINCTNTKTEFSVYIPAAVESPGVACVDLNTVYNILSKLPKDAEITFELSTGEKNELVLSQGARKYNLPVSNQDPQLFQTTEFPSTNSFFDENNEIATAIATVKPFVSPDESMEAISCILLRGENDSLSVVGLNGHQFCHVTRRTDFNAILDDDMLIGLKGLMEIKGWLFDGKAVEIAANEKRIFFRQDIEGVSTTFSLLRHNYLYPNYGTFTASIENCENPVSLICDRIEMLDSIKRLSVFTTENNRTVQFVHSSDSNKFDLTITGSETGKGVEPLEVEIEGNIPLISFPTSGLISILNTFASNKVCLTITGPESPCRIKGLDDQDNGISTILMPMLTQSESYEGNSDSEPQKAA